MKRLLLVVAGLGMMLPGAASVVPRDEVRSYGPDVYPLSNQANGCDCGPDCDYLITSPGAACFWLHGDERGVMLDVEDDRVSPVHATVFFEFCSIDCSGDVVYGLLGGEFCERGSFAIPQDTDRITVYAGGSTLTNTAAAACHPHLATTGTVTARFSGSSPLPPGVRRELRGYTLAAVTLPCDASIIGQVIGCIALRPGDTRVKIAVEDTSGLSVAFSYNFFGGDANEHFWRCGSFDATVPPWATTLAFIAHPVDVPPACAPPTTGRVIVDVQGTA